MCVQSVLKCKTALYQITKTHLEYVLLFRASESSHSVYQRYVFKVGVRLAQTEVTYEHTHTDAHTQ